LFLKLWFVIAFILCTAVSLSIFIPSWMALIVSVVVILLKLREPDLYIHNLGEILIYGGAVAVFTPLLTLVSVVVIMIAISFYDFVSVFITKHMITLAKTQKEEGIFAGLVVRFKDEMAILGGGDIAFPMLFASVVMREVSVIPAIFIIYGAALGLIMLIIFGKRKKYYPALPFITLGSFLGFGLGLLLG
jgi:presenilin-like A22 family membrane protease